MVLKDRAVIVTGSARGIRKVYANGIAAEGSKVVISDILDGDGTVEDIRRAGGEVIYVHTETGRRI
ncbi:MAG: hypothetical protein ACE5LU_11515 [Anaerolineae bacterium]